jgi:thiol:disulfide interchange protein
LQSAFNHRISRVLRFKKARVRTLSQKNKKLRIQYEKDHEYHTAIDYWQYVHFTNKTYFDLNQTFEERVLREENTRYQFENLQKMLEMKKKVKVHVAVFISWHHKKALQCYNDEHNMPEIQIKKSRKSRKKKYDTKDEHRQRVAEWKASLSHDVKIKSKNHNMTQTDYTDRLLLVYMNKIHECRAFHDRDCLFQEDNNSSHDTRSAENVVRKYKAVNWINTLYYSSQSFDLNSSEEL